MEFSLTVQEICKVVESSKIEGAQDRQIQGVASLTEAQPGDLSFLGNKKYKQQVGPSRASVVLLPSDYEGAPSDDQTYIRVENPSLALARLCRKIEASLWEKPASGIHPTAVIHSDAKIDPSASIGPHCMVGAGSKIGANTVLQAHVYIGNQVSIGDDCWLMPQVSIMDYCVLANRIRLHNGVVVGSDGFGYETVSGAHEKVPQIGRVVIEHDVEVGSNTTIDRARFKETRIGEGTKIDNLVQIGHNVIVGKHCLIVSFVGIAGSSFLEDYVVVGGQTGIAGHIRVGAGSMIGGRSGVPSDLPPKSIVQGAPPLPIAVSLKVELLKKKLPDLFKRVAKIEKLLDAM